MGSEKQLCLVTVGHRHFDLIRNRERILGYKLNSVVFAVDTDVRTTVMGIPAYGKQKMYQCIDNADTVYLPVECGLSIVEIDEICRYAQSHKKEILHDVGDLDASMGDEQRNEIEELCVPVVLVTSMARNMDKLEFSLRLRESFSKMYDIKATVVSQNEHGSLFGFYNLCDSFKKESGASNTINIIRKKLCQIQREENADVLIIVLPGELRDPYAANMYESDFFLMQIMRAVDIDYSIHIMPMNYGKTQDINNQKNVLKKQLNLECHKFVLSNCFYNLAEGMHESSSGIKIMIADEETINKCTASIGKVNDDKTYSEIVEEVVGRFKYTEKEYSVL